MTYLLAVHDRSPTACPTPGRRCAWCPSSPPWSPPSRRSPPRDVPDRLRAPRRPRSVGCWRDRLRERHRSRYADAPQPVLRDVTVHVPEGELCLVVGQHRQRQVDAARRGQRARPHFTGGTLSGRVRVAGRDTRDHPPRELADVVGVVGQNPAAGFVTDTVEDELAYTMESLGAARRRDAAPRRGHARPARARRPAGPRCRRCPAGRQQRVAIGAVLTAHPRVLVLDEPTSALDPGGRRRRARRGAPPRARPRAHRADGRAPARAGRAARRPLLWLPGDGAPVQRDDARARSWRRASIAPPVVSSAGRSAGRRCR